MEQQVLEAAKLYTMDRAAFNKKYRRNKIVGGFLDEMFLRSESRPDIAERIAIYMFGWEPSPVKRGYDGKTDRNRPIEVKVRNFISIDGVFNYVNATNSINDVSHAIVDRYEQDNPLFLFPYFFDGHLAAVFGVNYAAIAHKYFECLEKKHTGRRTFNLSAGVWIDSATLLFANKNPDVVAQLPRILRKKVDTK